MTSSKRFIFCICFLFYAYFFYLSVNEKKNYALGFSNSWKKNSLLCREFLGEFGIGKFCTRFLHFWVFLCQEISLSNFFICLIFSQPPRNSIFFYQVCNHLWSIWTSPIVKYSVFLELFKFIEHQISCHFWATRTSPPLTLVELLDNTYWILFFSHIWTYSIIMYLVNLVYLDFQ